MLFSCSHCRLKQTSFQGSKTFTLGNPEGPKWIHANQKTSIFKILQLKLAFLSISPRQICMAFRRSTKIDINKGLECTMPLAHSASIHMGRQKKTFFPPGRWSSVPVPCVVCGVWCVMCVYVCMCGMCGVSICTCNTQAESRRGFWSPPHPHPCSWSYRIHQSLVGSLAASPFWLLWILQFWADRFIIEILLPVASGLYPDVVADSCGKGRFNILRNLNSLPLSSPPLSLPFSPLFSLPFFSLPSLPSSIPCLFSPPLSPPLSS